MSLVVYFFGTQCRIPGLSCGFVCVIYSCFDRTPIFDGQTATYSIYGASTASCCKKIIEIGLCVSKL